jgi:hypothetical protein
MNPLEKEELQAAFTTSLLLPSGIEPRLRAALGQILSNPGSLVRPQIVLQMSMAYQLPSEHARALAIDLGDKAHGRLLLRKPAVAFLGVLRTSLQEEMARVTHGTCTNTARGGA